jgi:hypothetical protein
MGDGMNSITPQRSTFVSVVAWLFIIFSGLTSLIAIAQNLLLHLFFPLDELKEKIATSQHTENIPPLTLFMTTHMDWIFGLFLLVSLLTFVSAIGLLNRQNWARLVFIGLMVAGVLWNLGSLVMQQTIMVHMPPPPPNAPEDFKARMEAMQTIMTAFMVVFCLGFSALFGWIGWKLHTPAIAAEFKRAERALI